VKAYLTYVERLAKYYNAVDEDFYLVPERKWSFLPISASNKNLNPQKTPSIPPVKILIFLDLDKKPSFSFRHYL